MNTKAVMKGDELKRILLQAGIEHNAPYVWATARVVEAAVLASADRPVAAQYIPANFTTHRAAWRDAITACINYEKTHGTADQAAYWQHELAAYDRSFARLLDNPEPVRNVASADNPSTAGAAVPSLELILNCYSPDDTVGDYQDKIRALYTSSGHQQSATVREKFDVAFLSLNGFHAQAELNIEWANGSLSGEMFRAGVASVAAPVAQSTAGAAKGGITEFESGCIAELCNRIVAAKEEPIAISVEAAVVIRRLLAAPALNPSEVRDQAQWISVEDRLPDAENEDTSRDVMVSDSLFIRGIAIDGGEAIGLGDYSPDAHVPDAGWRCYGGDYDFMHFAKVTHWMKPGRPAAPEQSALGEKGCD